MAKKRTTAPLWTAGRPSLGFVWDVLLLVALAAVWVGVAPLLDQDHWRIPGAVLLLAAAAFRWRHGWRRAMRRVALSLLLEAVGPDLGHPRDQIGAHLIRVRWSRTDPNIPTYVRLRYHAAVDVLDPRWRPALAKKLSSRFGSVNFKVADLDERRCLVELVPVPKSEELSPAAKRAENSLKQMLGQDLTVKKSEVTPTGDLTRIEVTHHAGVKVASKAIRAKVERSFSTTTKGRWRSLWDLERDRLTMELRPVLPDSVPHPVETLTKKNQYLIPLGVSEDGELLFWDLRGTGPHLVVVGKTGTGKTVVINGAVTEFTRRGWKVWICDPKRIEFMGMRAWPNVQVVATTVEDMIAVIRMAWVEMERRYELIESRKADEDDFEPMLLVLDEYRDFYGQVTAWYDTVKVTGMPRKCPVFDWVALLAAKARSAKIHLLLGTQRPDATFLEGGMRDNFDTRISLGRLSPQGAQMMWESPAVGVAVPRRKPGRGTAMDGNDEPVEMQAFWTPDPRRLRDTEEGDRALLRALMSHEIRHPQMRVELGSPEPDLDDDGGKKKPKQSEDWIGIMDSRMVPVTLPNTDPLAVTTTAADPAAARWSFEKTGAEASRAVQSEPTGPPAVVHEDAEIPDDDLDAEYGPVISESAARIRAGDLVLVDEDLDVWGVVVSDPEPSDDDDDVFVFEYRCEDEDGGWLELPEETPVEIRHPLDDNETANAGADMEVV